MSVFGEPTIIMLVHCKKCDRRFKIGFEDPLESIGQPQPKHELECTCGEKIKLTVWFPPPDFDHSEVPYGKRKEAPEQTASTEASEAGEEDKAPAQEGT